MKTSLFSRFCPLSSCCALALAGAILSLTAGSAFAQQIINNFEGGTFGPNGSTAGDASIVGADFFTPAAGSRQALVTTFSSAADGGNVSGTDATTAANVETFLGLNAGTLAANGANLSDASSFKLVRFTLNVGDAVSFNYNFLSNATAADGQDFSFVTLQRGGGDPTFQVLANVAAAATTSTSAFFDHETGSVLFALAPVTTAGTYTLGFGVTDAFDDAVGSGLLIDNVQINAVPEPSVLAGMVVLGGLSLVVTRRRVRCVKAR